MPAAGSPVLHDHAPEREAELLAELVRLSSVTVLLAETGAAKSTFLAESVLPLLAASAAAESEICVSFDSWDDAPLPKLLAQIRRAIPALDSRRANNEVPSVSLAATLARWQHALGATFIIIFDRFEDHLAARDRPGAAEFEDEFVRVIDTPQLRAHFVVALEAEAAPLLGPLRQRIPGFGDTIIRLPPAHHRTVAEPGERLVGAAPKTQPLVGSAAQAQQALARSDAPEASTRATVLTGSIPPDRAPSALQLPETRTAAVGASASVPRLPRAAWAVLGLLLCSALGLLLLTIWQPRRDVAEDTAMTAGQGPDAVLVDTQSSAHAAPSTPSSPADDQVALPLIKNDVPRAVAASGPERNAPPLQPSTAPVLAPAVYLHVRTDAQRAWAERLIQPLAKRGVRVTGIRVVKAGPGETDLRYFRREEAAEASRVARALREVGVPPPRLKRVAGFESRSPERQFELWLGPLTAPAPRKPPRPHP